MPRQRLGQQVLVLVVVAAQPGDETGQELRPPAGFSQAGVEVTADLAAAVGHRHLADHLGLVHAGFGFADLGQAPGHDLADDVRDALVGHEGEPHRGVEEDVQRPVHGILAVGGHGSEFTVRLRQARQAAPPTSSAARPTAHSPTDVRRAPRGGGHLAERARSVRTGGRSRTPVAAGVDERGDARDAGLDDRPAGLRGPHLADGQVLGGVGRTAERPVVGGHHEGLGAVTGVAAGQSEKADSKQMRTPTRPAPGRTRWPHGEDRSAAPGGVVGGYLVERLDERQRLPPGDELTEGHQVPLPVGDRQPPSGR